MMILYMTHAVKENSNFNKKGREENFSGAPDDDDDNDEGKLILYREKRIISNDNDGKFSALHPRVD